MCIHSYISYIGLLWKEPTSAAGPELEAACKALGGHHGISVGVFGAFGVAGQQVDTVDSFYLTGA